MTVSMSILQWIAKVRQRRVTRVVRDNGWHYGPRKSRAELEAGPMLATIGLCWVEGKITKLGLCRAYVRHTLQHPQEVGSILAGPILWPCSRNWVHVGSMLRTCWAQKGLVAPILPKGQFQKRNLEQKGPPEAKRHTPGTFAGFRNRLGELILSD